MSGWAGEWAILADGLADGTVMISSKYPDGTRSEGWNARFWGIWGALWSIQ
jgi:hypothetical protein